MYSLSQKHKMIVVTSVLAVASIAAYESQATHPSAIFIVTNTEPAVAWYKNVPCYQAEIEDGCVK